MRRNAKAFALGAAVLTMASLGVVWASPSGGVPQAEARHSADWPFWQKDASGSRYNGAEWKINPRTVGKLELKWAYTFARLPYTRVGSQPAIVDGVLYVGAPDAKFVALDAKSGATKWTFDLTAVTGPGEQFAANGVRDGAAVVGDKVYFGDSTGRVYALDKRTGRLVWAAHVDEHPLANLTSSPSVYNGRVYIGLSTSEGGATRDPSYPCCTHRGAVVALDADTGAEDWRFHTVPEPVETGTWPSGAKKFEPSGASVWATPVVDRRTGTVFVGTGNNATGQTAMADSMLAIDAETGRLRWKQQVTFPDTYTAACEMTEVPDETCPGKGTYALDKDIGATATLVEVGRRTLVVVGQKDGRLHAFDARTGRIAWQTPLVPNSPDAVGVQWGTAYDGRYLYAATWHSDPGRLFAVDPVDGDVVWEARHPADGCTTGGAAAFAEMCELSFTPAVSATPGLIYEGSSDGKIRIFSSRNGDLLWEFDAIRDFAGVNGVPGRGSGISGNGGAVIVDGMLYVQAGYYPFYPTDKGTVLLAFGL
ncbi:PQQ-binding-like beta-propeller repeat protein [Actinophytocola sp. NPDC049390]|uniref:outer membrane protein assembly factor BamB family protein n=1 Tax=Actinophytocola sp. NPDC049390 TaxID=3363894 RepID=UPI00379BEB88